MGVSSLVNSSFICAYLEDLQRLISCNYQISLQPKLVALQRTISVNDELHCIAIPRSPVLSNANSIVVMISGNRGSLSRYLHVQIRSNLVAATINKLPHYHNTNMAALPQQKSQPLDSFARYSCLAIPILVKSDSAII